MHFLHFKWFFFFFFPLGASMRPWGQAESITWVRHSLLRCCPDLECFPIKRRNADLTATTWINNIGMNIFFPFQGISRLHVWIETHHEVMYLITPMLQMSTFQSTLFVKMRKMFPALPLRSKDPSRDSTNLQPGSHYNPPATCRPNNFNIALE